MKSKLDLPVLYVDDDLLVVSKPSGLPTLPDGYDADSPFLAGLLEPAYGPVWVVHRLDRDTSGVVVLARNAEAHRALNEQFQEREVAKVYHALVAGHPVWQERDVSAPLRIDADRHHRTLVDLEAGKPSVTRFRALEQFLSGSLRFTLVEAMPRSGRMHQIRVHLVTLGLPVVADRLYGDGQPLLLSSIKGKYRLHADEEEERPLLGRLGLHALRVAISHPADGQTRVFEAPYPKDFAAALNQLRKHAARRNGSAESTSTSRSTSTST
jgi:RluA family pseudouridine synthase